MGWYVSVLHIFQEVPLVRWFFKSLLEGEVMTLFPSFGSCDVGFVHIQDQQIQGYWNFQLSPFSCDFVILYFSLGLFGCRFLSRAGKYLSILLLKLICALGFVLAVSSTLHILMLSLFHRSQSY